MVLPLAALAALDPAAITLEIELTAEDALDAEAAVSEAAMEDDAVSEVATAEEVIDPEGTGPEVPPMGGPEGVTEFPALAAADANADSVSVDYKVRI